MASPQAQVRTRPMTTDEFAAYRAASIAGYAADRARARGTRVEDELTYAESTLDEALPDGPATEGHQVLLVLDATGARAGILWIGPHPALPRAWYVYDIEMDPARRGEGLGRATMLAAEVAARAAGAEAIGLNVFGFNHAARRLYESLNYRTVAIQMTKDLT